MNTVFINKFFKNIKLDSWLLKGKEQKSQEDLTVLYAGSKYGKNYFCKIIYNRHYQESFLGKKWFWDLFRLNIRVNNNCSLIILESFYFFYKLFQKDNDFVIPSWVSTIIDTSCIQPRFLKNKSLKNDIRRINKNRLSFQLTHESFQFNNFYYNIYKPYIEKVHKDNAIIDDYYYMKKKFNNNYILALIKKENTFIGGNLISCNGKQGKIWHIGVKDGNIDYVKKGVVQAMFYFSSIWLKDRGCKSINLGLCRPFLNDGVLRFKKKWSPAISYKKWLEKIFLFKFIDNTPGLQNFLINNPFIFIKNNSLTGAIFIANGSALSKQNLNRIYKFYYFNGLAKLYLYQFQRDINKQLIIPDYFFDKIKFCSTEDLFKNIQIQEEIKKLKNF
ncbi:MAG: hypothetical protein AMJ95_01165 [Omnitrophica WOR_2 bacterium SM23_72]|nr:MAG: hypothetical protein AMJ95_01165 [Omnitrophica WOR_2 bacterium SM23_72]